MNKTLKIALILVSTISFAFMLHVIIANNNTNAELTRFYDEAPKLNIKNLEPGDLLFARNYGTAIIPGYWTHTAIFAGYNEEGIPLIIESKRQNGVTKTNLKQFLERAHVAVAKIQGANEKTKLKALEFANQKVGLPFNINYFSKGVDQSKYYCSELIWAAYKKAGIDLDDKTGWEFKLTEAVAPQEIFTHPSLEIYQLEI